MQPNATRSELMNGAMKDANGPVAKELRIGQTIGRKSICNGAAAEPTATDISLGAGAACAAGDTSRQDSVSAKTAATVERRQCRRANRASTGTATRIRSFILISHRQPPSEYGSDSKLGSGHDSESGGAGESMSVPQERNDSTS